MAFGKSQSKEKPTVPVRVHLGHETLEVMVELYGDVAQDSSIWATLSTYISGGTITRNTTTDGRRVIINWPQVHAISYDAD